MALTDKKNRKKLSKAVNDLTAQAQKMTRDLQKNRAVKTAVKTTVKKTRPAIKSATKRAVSALS